jgi:hypothetical protein
VSKVDNARKVASFCPDPFYTKDRFSLGALQALLGIPFAYSNKNFFLKSKKSLDKIFEWCIE